MQKAAIVLAAGKGKRMKSDLPKVLHTINEKPIIAILLDTLKLVGFEKIVVVIGHRGEMVKEALSQYDVEFVWQREQRGTGDAVKSAQKELEGFKGMTLVAAGDVPFLSQDAIGDLFDGHIGTVATATCLTAILDDASGYGRIIRDSATNRLKSIVEDRDASSEELEINEINTGTFCFDNSELFLALDEVETDNSQGEYYLTDVVKILNDKGLPVSAVIAKNPDELLGVNSQEDLSHLSGLFGKRL